MTRHNEISDQRARLLAFAADKHAIRAADAADHLRISVTQAARLLDELVASGAAERLRPIGCDHSRYDHYRLACPD